MIAMDNELMLGVGWMDTSGQMDRSCVNGG